MKDISEIVEIIEKAYVAAITNTSIGKSNPISMKLHDLIVQFHPSKQRRIQQLQELNGVRASNVSTFRSGNMATYTGAMVNTPPVVKKTKMEDFGKHRTGDTWNPPYPQDQPQNPSLNENVVDEGVKNNWYGAPPAIKKELDIIDGKKIEITTPSKRGRKPKAEND